MTVYETRLEIFKLAQAIESENVWAERQRLEQDWNAKRQDNETKGLEPPAFPALPVTTLDTVIKTAETINNFVGATN